MANDLELNTAQRARPHVIQLHMINYEWIRIQDISMHLHCRRTHYRELKFKLVS